MAFYIAGHHRQTGVHGLHDIEGKPLAAAGGHGAVRRPVTEGGIPELTGKAHPLRQPQLLRQSLAGPALRTLSREQEHGPLRQAAEGLDEKSLMLPPGEFRGVDHQKGGVGDTQFPAVCPPIRLADRVQPPIGDPHARDKANLAAQAVAPGQRLVGAVHDQHQICAGGGEPFGGQKDLPLGGGRVVVEEIAVDRIDDAGAVLPPQKGQPGEKGRQGGMGDDQIIGLTLHQFPQAAGTPQVFRRGHPLCKGDVHHAVGFGKRHGRSAAGHMHGPSRLPEGAQIG